MLVRCAWCRKALGATGDPSDPRESHGICNSCFSHLEASHDGMPLRRFLDSLEVPVTLVDDDFRVVHANRSAQAVLEKPPEALAHHLGGEVLECENSYLPGGCGQTEHCPSCTLRNAVARCHETGVAEDGIVTTIQQRGTGGPVEVSIRLSTRRVHDLVLLRIDTLEK